MNEFVLVALFTFLPTGDSAHSVLGSYNNRGECHTDKVFRMGYTYGSKKGSTYEAGTVTTADGEEAYEWACVARDSKELKYLQKLHKIT